MTSADLPFTVVYLDSSQLHTQYTVWISFSKFKVSTATIALTGGALDVFFIEIGRGDRSQLCRENGEYLFGARFVVL